MSLTAINLTAGYGRHAVVADVNATLPAGRTTVLIGANGSGKSTLLRTLTGAQAALAGRVELDGREINAYKPGQLARKLSLVLTDRTGGGGLRVDELVGIGRHPYSGFLGRMSAADREAVERAICLVGLGHKSAEFVASLSDGERQKAMIARALAQSTGLMVLDEPTSFLDVAARFEITDLLSMLSREEGKTILLSTHDTAAALAAADNVWALCGGHIYAGSVDELREGGVLDRVYPGMRYDAAAKDFRRMLNVEC